MGKVTKKIEPTGKKTVVKSLGSGRKRGSSGDDGTYISSSTLDNPPKASQSKLINDEDVEDDDKAQKFKVGLTLTLKSDNSDKAKHSIVILDGLFPKELIMEQLKSSVVKKKVDKFINKQCGKQLDNDTYNAKAGNQQEPLVKEPEEPKPALTNEVIDGSKF
jgi:hypothetical protein